MTKEPPHFVKKRSQAAGKTNYFFRIIALAALLAAYYFWPSKLSVAVEKARSVTNAQAQRFFGSHVPSSCQKQVPKECSAGPCQDLQKTILESRSASTWNDYYRDIEQFIESRSLHGGVMVEIGVAYGGLAQAIISKFPGIQYHAVDPFMADYDNGDAMSQFLSYMKRELGLTTYQLSKMWARAIETDLIKYAEPCQSRFTLHHDKSVPASFKFARASVDVAFIDGLHTYEGVRDDIEAWLYVMKPGSYFVFNDYGTGMFPGVDKAVVELQKRVGGQLEDLGKGNVVLRLPETCFTDEYLCNN